MSQILVLNPPFNGLTAIANVTNRVGPAEIDNPNDVKVVQTLIRMLKTNFAKKVGLPAVTGNFDAATGFWIYDTQQYLKSKGGHSNLVVDGIVSPAHGAVYASGAPWTIVLFNLYAKRDSPAEYAAFLTQLGASH